MTGRKNTKHALFLSALSLILCLSLLVGSTYAWFNDSVTSGRNKIASGIFEVELYHSDSTATDEAVGEDTVLFDDVALWEPGAMVWEKLTVKNVGTLSMKYTLKVEITDIKKTGTKSLADVLEVAVLSDVPTRESVKAATKQSLKSFVLKSDAILDENASESFYVAIYWAPSANDNDYNLSADELSAKIGVTLVAAQGTVESDSYGSEYDEDAICEIVVAEGTEGGVTWTLTDTGKLTISPAAVSIPDPNCGKEFDEGAWREAVVYNSAGTGVAIGGYPYNVNAVKSLVFEEGITSIGSFTAKFPNLTGEVVIPASVTYIGQEAFQNTKITKLTFAAGGTEELCIGPGAFKSMAITELEFPEDRPVHMHCWAFNGCTKLETVTIPANVTSFSSWTHADYMGLSWVDGKYRYSSDVFDKCSSIKTMIFGSQEVYDKFMAADGNANTINNEIGNVTIIIK